MSFTILNKRNVAVSIDDLGIEVSANGTYNLESESAHDVAISVDLPIAINAGDIVVLDPREATPTTELTAADSVIVTQSHNDPHYGIRGAGVNDLDDVDTTGAVAGDLLQLIGTTYTVVPPSTVAADILLGDLKDVVDGIGTKPTTDFYVLVGDGFGGAVLTDAKTDNAVFIPFIEDTAGAVISDGAQTDITLTYNAANNTVDVSVDDSYLRNDGDSLDSGTLNIASGAAFTIATGAVGTIEDQPVNDNDIANKFYVDSVAQGTDNKDSVYLATSPAHGDMGGTYNPVGGTGGTGAFTNITDFIIDGIDIALRGIGTRMIVKDNTDPRQNGIYVISAINAGSPGSIDLERSSDMDGNPSTEVSPGNLAFVEEGTVNGNTSWIVTGTIDPIIVNTDPINWTQFSGAGSYTAGRGLNLNGTQFFLDIANLNPLAVVGADEIAFNDISDPGITKKRTFTNVIADLGLLTDTNLTASDGVLITNNDIQLDITGLPSLTSPSLNAEMVFDAGGTGIHNKGTVANFFHGLDVVHGVTSDGIVTRTADDVYTSRAIVASILAGEEGSLVTNGDGVLGNPTVGIDIVGTTASGNNMAATDLMLMYNATSNVTVSGTQLANGILSIIGPFNAYTNIAGDTGSTTATSSTDSLAFLNATNGGIVTLASDGGPDTVTFAIDGDDLATGTGTVDLTDTLMVIEGAGAANSVKYTFQDMITDLNISTSGSLIGNDGVEVVGNTVSLDFVNLPAQAGGTPAVDPGDIFAIDPIVSDSVNAGTHKKVTFTDLLKDLTVVHSLGGTGFAVQTGADAYSARTLSVSSAAGSQGLTLTNGDGVAANPLFGFTITTLTGSGGNLAATNELVLYDGTNNVKVTGQQIADGVSSMLGGIGNAYTTITGDTGSATAISSTDILNFGGAAGGGITTSVTDASPDTVDFTIDFNALIPRATAVTAAMLLGIGEGVAAPTTSRSIGNILTDLGVPNGLGTSPGILVSNGANGYLATAIAVNAIGALDGLAITNGNGVAGAPTLGLDIVGLPATGAILDAGDILVVNHASGSGANESITGQNLADGISNIIGLGNLAVTTINGQQVLTLVDTTRTNKILSVSETEFVWAENRLHNNDWVSIGTARDAKSGHIMPLNGTIVRITAHTSNDKNNAKDINLYIDGTLDGTLGSFPGSGGESTIVDEALNIDFIQGGKLRLRAGGGGPIEDTTISIFVKWRG